MGLINDIIKAGRFQIEREEKKMSYYITKPTSQVRYSSSPRKEYWPDEGRGMDGTARAWVCYSSERTPPGRKYLE